MTGESSGFFLLRKWFTESLSRHLTIARVQKCAGKFLSCYLFCLTSGSTEIFVLKVNYSLFFCSEGHISIKMLDKIPLYPFSQNYVRFMMLLSGL
jgi:hypothetical protein